MSEALLLVTGSRTYADKQYLDDTLWEAYCGLVVSGPFSSLRLLHGHNKKGADALADAWALSRYYEGVRVKREAADWAADCIDSCQRDHRRPSNPYLKKAGFDTYCPAQGNYRNQRMVDMHPVAAVAFLWQYPSKGTEDCMGKSVAANVPTLICRRLQRPVWADPMNTAWSVD